ncbi:MBL fold metallo-hydrolase [Actinomadura sp. WMMB 499]|uniref:MBL fold metallo-hydrolase n=1 Tax=Actinomadura sp. WMMB 499 TaxID=1219491 RepID=UPI001245B509|nr:MBL fold metallo-hydrolase [Actinomadura sp. WMMB 499]QFG25181.1 MBL fold metallo-hydrolase [Actinomadura sp. WMMB 499]
MTDVEIIETAALGDRSHVAHDGEQAIVVDPQRDLDRVTRVLDDLGLRCALVLETHVHNDYVSGGLALARATGAGHGLPATALLAFDHRPMADGDELDIGGLHVRTVATPGHTDAHVAYVVDGGPGGTALFTGGSLLYGTVGRTDLVAPSRTGELARAQYRSAHRLAELAGDDARVYPTHGFGSFCSSAPATADTVRTLGDERARNTALTEPSEDAFVSRLVAGLTAYPRYYAQMGERNLAGAGPADLSPPAPVAPAELAARIARGEWVVDLRSRTAYAAAHARGTVGIELGRPFATYIGWLIPWGAPLTLVGDSPEQIADAQRQLVRIGVERPAGAAVGSPAEVAAPSRVTGYPTAAFADVPTGATVLDVRRADERADDAVAGSIGIPLHSLEALMDEVPDEEIWVHCASGYRASIAASLLDRAGHDVVLIDDDFPAAAAAGLTASPVTGLA